MRAVLPVIIAVVTVVALISSIVVSASSYPRIYIVNPSIYASAAPITTGPASFEVVSGCKQYWSVSPSEGALSYSAPSLPGETFSCIVRVSGQVALAYRVSSGQLELSAQGRRTVLSGSGTTYLNCTRGCVITLVPKAPLYTVARGELRLERTVVGKPIAPISGYAQLLPNSSMMYVFEFRAPRGEYRLCFRPAPWQGWRCWIEKSFSGRMTVVIPNPIAVEVPPMVAANYPVEAAVKGRCVSGVLYLDGKPILNGTFPARTELMLSRGKHVLRAVCINPPAIALAYVEAVPITVSWSIVNGWRSFEIVINTSIRSGLAISKDLGVEARIANGSAVIRASYSSVPPAATAVTITLVDSATGARVSLTIPVLRPRLVVTPSPSGYVVSLVANGQVIPAKLELEDGTVIVLNPQTLLATLPRSPISRVVASYDRAIVVPPHVSGATLASLAIGSRASVSVSAVVVDEKPFETVVRIGVSTPPTAKGVVALVQHDKVIASAPLTSGYSQLVAAVTSNTGGYVLTEVLLNNSIVAYVAVPVTSLNITAATYGDQLKFFATEIGPSGSKPFSGVLTAYVCGNRIELRFVDGIATAKLPQPWCLVRVYASSRLVLSIVARASIALPMSPTTAASIIMVLSAAVGLYAFEARKEEVIRPELLHPQTKEAPQTCFWSALFEKWIHEAMVNWGNDAIPLTELEVARIADTSSCLPPPPQEVVESVELAVERMRMSGRATVMEIEAYRYWEILRARMDRFLERLRKHSMVVKEHRVAVKEINGLRFLAPASALRKGMESIVHNAMVRAAASVFIAAGWSVYAPKALEDQEPAPDLFASLGKRSIAIVEVVREPQKLSRAKIIDLATRICAALLASEEYETAVIVVTDNVLGLYRALASAADAEPLQKLIEEKYLYIIDIGKTRYIVARGHPNELAAAAEARARNVEQAVYRRAELYITDLEHLPAIVEKLSRSFYESIAKLRI